VIILGIDPGLRTTGWGVIKRDGSRLIHLGHGTVKSDASDDLARRLVQLHDGLLEVIDAWTPDAASVEETFVNKNPASTLKLGAARGVALLMPALRGVPVFEYAANHIKKAVVGVGHADKIQVHAMVSRLLPSAKSATSDAADALAIAICHAHQANYNAPAVVRDPPRVR
jgi:crossover junction endodeoxyribonuclease RuvC